MMNKKLRAILIVLGAVLVLWGTVFFVDYSRATSLKAPIFVVSAGVTADDGGSGTYYGLGYTVYVKKSIDPDYGVTVRAVEMRMFGNVIGASVT